MVDRSDMERNEEAQSRTAQQATKPSGKVQPIQPDPIVANGRDEVSEEIRAQLAAMSTTFAPDQKVEKTAALPFPSETISNKVTRFLALSKVETGRDMEFLQLLEIDPLAAASHDSTLDRPLKLEYDPEWLAILRVFASELALGGDFRDQISPHLGDTHYRERIIEEEKWIQENVTDKNLLVIPENFEVTTGTDQGQGAQAASDNDMPREQTNPQTARFCELIGIENKFDFSEEDRDARIAIGPGNPGTDGHRGGRGRGGHGRGRGRGRDRSRGGRGRGRW